MSFAELVDDWFPIAAEIAKTNSAQLVAAMMPRR